MIFVSYEEMRAEKLLAQRPGPNRNVLLRSSAMARRHLPKVGSPVQFPMMTELAQSGIYFLWLDGEIVYVGQAINMRCRIGGHLAEGRKWFDAISYVPCSVEKLTALERSFIQHYMPKLNKCVIATEARRKFGEVKRPEGREVRVWVTADEAASMLSMELADFYDLNAHGLGPKPDPVKGYLRKDVVDYRMLALRMS